MNRISAGSVAGILACGLVLVGCRGSTRSLDLGSSEFSIGTPRQLQPPGAMPTAASSDGKVLCVLTAGLASLGSPGSDDKGRVRLEVRDFDSQKVLRYFEWTQKEAFWPFMVSRDHAALFGCVMNERRNNEILKLNLASGKMKMVFKKPSRLRGGWGHSIGVEAYSVDHSILFFDDGIYLTHTGKVVQVGEDVHRSWFDMYGNAWFQSKGVWHRLVKDGEVSVKAKRPETLYVDQIDQRGGMRLYMDSAERKRKGGEALLDLVWIEHKGARGKEKAALAFAGADVLASGFLPGRNEVVVVTGHDGTYFVPFSVKSKPNGPSRER